MASDGMSPAPAPLAPLVADADAASRSPFALRPPGLVEVPTGKRDWKPTKASTSPRRLALARTYEKERECVCVVCVCVRERQRDRERE